MKRFAALTFGTVLVASAILAVLGYLSLRRWEASAELLFREQARDMATPQFILTAHGQGYRFVG